MSKNSKTGQRTRRRQTPPKIIVEKSAIADRKQLSSIEQFAEQISGYASSKETSNSSAEGSFSVFSMITSPEV